MSSFCCFLEKHTIAKNPEEISHDSRIILFSNNGLQIDYPKYEEVIEGQIIIRWIFTYPYSLARDIRCQIYYSKDSELNWIHIGIDIYEKYFVWNTAEYEKYGSDFIIKITAISKEWIEELYVISENSFTIDNRDTSFENKSMYAMLIIPIMVISMGSFAGIVASRFRLQNRYSSDLLETDHIEKIKTIRQKVEIGIENINNNCSWFPETNLISETTIPFENNPIFHFYSSNFLNELKYEISGRTVIVLIEIACQNPIETNPKKIAKRVGIPVSTISNEIRKLIDLNYIKSYISNQVLLDARKRNYTITKKGCEFLLALNDVLKTTLKQVQKMFDGFPYELNDEN
ncbi:MAG: winged helix-turn-helix transcriptional regulator [Asgard group archaeon]|nr:winged helix-turn-helix transcriptional regulator [Asgard group archaeon]